MRWLRLLLVVGLVLGLILQPVIAQPKYPVRPLTLIVPWGAGGGTDRISRIVALLLEKDLGEPVIVVNRTGGNGAIGHTAGATAIPDGYTLTMVTVEIVMLHWMGLAEVSHKDFRGVALINFDPAGISVRAAAPWKTYRDLQNYIKGNPGKLKAMGSPAGGIWDLARAGWIKTAGLPPEAVQVIPVPTTGAAAALQELVAGGIDIVTVSLPEVAPLVAAGQIRPLAIMAEQRDPLFPDVPTLQELGVKWSLGTWRGIAVPKFTPTTVVNVVEKALDRAVRNPEFQDFMRKNGFGVLYRSSKDFTQMLTTQDTVMGQLMKEAGQIK